MVSTGPTPAWRILWSLLILLGVCAVGLSVFSQLATDQLSNRKFTEGGPIEQVGPLLWLALAALVLWVMRRINAVSLASVYVCIACAAREWDLHNRFTGDSVLKFDYYTSSEHPLAYQLTGAVFVALLALSCATLLWHTWRIWPRGGQPVAPWIWCLCVAGIMLGGTKVLDRAPGILSEDHDIQLGPALSRLFEAWEEGLETIIPLAFAAMVLAYRYRDPEQKPGDDTPD